MMETEKDSISRAKREKIYDVHKFNIEVFVKALKWTLRRNSRKRVEV